ncbi:ABC transporter ATP-binding protein [Solirubrobacter sp. CPCC 204708]|uniref:Dipeptide/oligopeptide/nickel ABC transporter ATP-binding protein n=1 Tax=Solirubrobacter deserti TaxID=2282478 RepID=A0ABT4RU68_9ACTN|nr:dipeptide/oligopeptide/nickel ABC transporter ATP-binding protein [Solirubrobacter deserti]MBE2316340.1 ABC transporter ATP-binding protein [Solirubrobacter deserti]MDA0142128.1 dipeptide/oligopeptide/nickel ABC transporter ATP-binding protein [Solirubrobacter deserti]
MNGRLVVDDVHVRFGDVVAVDGVSLDLAPGEILGLVGDSGCGKTTLARVIVGLEQPQAGRVFLDGEDLTALRGARRREVRRRVQLVFQDPESSLSPRLTIGQTLEEPLLVAGMRSRRERVKRVTELLELVGLPATLAGRRPRALSGGQRQRIGIARALASKPDVLVCDEPVSSLDASVRAQVMNVLLDLRDELDVSVLLIAHDHDLVRQASDRVLAMAAGRLGSPAQALQRR